MPPNPDLKTQKRDTFRVRNFFADGLLRAAQLSSLGHVLINWGRWTTVGQCPLFTQ